MKESWLDQRATWRGGMWVSWLAVSMPLATRLVRRGPVGVVVAIGLLLLPAWVPRVIDQTRRVADQATAREPSELHDWERGILERLHEASAIAQSALGSAATRRELESAISDARTKLRSVDANRKLGDEMERVAALLDQLVQESVAARERDDIADDLRGAIEAADIHAPAPEELRLFE